MQNNDILKWLQDWYLSQCNEDWEHSYGIKIDTVDNPGWHVTIDLKETSIENLYMKYTLVEKSENDWYGYKVENSQYIATGDPLKLHLILEIFKKIVLDNKI